MIAALALTIITVLAMCGVVAFYDQIEKWVMS